MKDKNGIQPDGFPDDRNEAPQQEMRRFEVKSHPLRTNLATGAGRAGEGRFLRSWQRFLTRLLRGLSLPAT
jgi:hypothetical protein